MRRSLGGLMLIAAAVLVALSVGMWWMQRVAFTPSNDAGAAHSILGDDEIRGQVATIVAGADASVLGQSPAELREFIEQIALIPEGAALMSEFIGDAHGRLIGSSDDRVVITAQEQVNIVRNELVGEAAPLTLPVQKVGSIAFVADWLTWVALGTLGLGLLVALAGVLLRPERGEGTFALGVFFAATAGSLVIFGYLVPLLVLPAFSDRRLPGRRRTHRVRHEQPPRAASALDSAQRRQVPRRTHVESLIRTSSGPTDERTDRIAALRSSQVVTATHR
jgi:hypothetical protein